MTIRAATAEDIPTIRTIALRTWPVAYGAIPTPAQPGSMLDLKYSTDALADRFQAAGHCFAIREADGEARGFAGYEDHHATTRSTRLHKLYVTPTA
ncbi:MAG: hypothetical protein IT225_01715 [Flavobacteriales bacterium]|nr:hypothetical protein [Flavobacteriales bacterium]